MLRQKQNTSINYLRTFIIILVLIYHSILAYTPLSHISPITDSSQSLFFDFLIYFFDSFIMASLFFVSGLFVWPSLERKGVKKFTKDRLVRLGLPFLIIVIFSYVITKPEVSNHLWFIWVLIQYNLLIALLYKFVPRLKEKLFTQKIFSKTWSFLISLSLFSFAAHLLMAVPWGIEQKFLFYLVYFLFGVTLGMYGIETFVSNFKKHFTNKWWLLLCLGFLIFFARITYIVPITEVNLINMLSYSFSSALILFAVLAIFLKFFQKTNKIFDKLSNNAYGIYLVHYPIILALQYLLLNYNLSANTKALIVFLPGLFISLLLSHLLRKSTTIKKII